MKQQTISGSEFVLYSDGGGERASSAAGACIIENVATGERTNYVTFLGPGTNNEAEICGALTGFSALYLSKREGTPVGQVRWVCDSEYVLKSATQYIRNWVRNGWKTADKKPVKNQGLWLTYLLLSHGLDIKAEHVRGHTGHPENEACDTASTWARNRGSDHLHTFGDGVTAEIGDEEWVVLDGRQFLDDLRADEPEESMMEALVEAIAAAQSRTTGGESKRAKPDPGRAQVQRALRELEGIADRLKGVRSEAAELLQLRKALEDLLAKF